MTETQTISLVLLDIRDEYRRFEEQYAASLFVRITDKRRCVLHVLSRRSNVQLFHLFIPNVENTLIRARVCLFKNTIFYIYCIDEATVRLMKRTYNYPMFVKVFHVDELSIYLHQSAIIDLVEKAGRSRAEQNETESDAALQEAKTHLDQLANELENYMIIQTGRQPDDRQ